jgi:hypothetical protein
MHGRWGHHRWRWSSDVPLPPSSLQSTLCFPGKSLTPDMTLVGNRVQGVTLSPELWLVKLLVGAIDPT